MFCLHRHKWSFYNAGGSRSLNGRSDLCSPQRLKLCEWWMAACGIGPLDLTACKSTVYFGRAIAATFSNNSHLLTTTMATNMLYIYRTTACCIGYNSKSDSFSPQSLPPLRVAILPFISPDIYVARSKGLPLIFYSPPGNQHLNNSLSANQGIWCFYANRHPSSFRLLISQHPAESEAKTWGKTLASQSASCLALFRSGRMCLSCLFYGQHLFLCVRKTNIDV